MSEQLSAVTDAMTEAIAHQLGGAIEEAGLVATTEPSAEEAVKFEFDAEFQTRVVYLAATDAGFMRKVAHLLKPEYFTNADEAAFMAVVQRHWQQYETTMNEVPIMILAIQDAQKAKTIRKEHVDGIKVVVKNIFTTAQAIKAGEFYGLNADFVADHVADWCREQAVISAVYRAADLIERQDQYAKIEKLISDAIKVGIDQEENGGDYFERLAKRTAQRADDSVGKRPPRGITTGHSKLDNLLYHKGWGRRELNVLMGGAKAGKTTALIEFGAGACLAGYNVLYVTLEVSNTIVEERIDARFSEVPMSDLVGKFSEVNERVEELAAAKKTGRFYIAEFPSGSMSPSMLKSLLERHKAKGLTYDMVIVDYADIMAPDYRTNDPIENTKQVYIGLRAIAQEWNVAMLTATQSNREGYKSVTAKAEHVSDDFNKVRTADLFISINSTEEERRDGKARLYFAASRNQRSGMTVFITQNFNMMKFIEKIERVE